MTTRVAFLGRGGAGGAMEQRARGLARHFPDSFTSTFVFPAGYRDVLDAARDADVVWLFSQHPLMILASRVGGVPFVVDTGDLVEESLGTEGRARFVSALGGVFERASVRAADAVVVRGSAHVPLAESWGAREVVLIPDGVEVDDLARCEAGALREKIGAAGPVTVGVIATISLDANGRPSPGWDVVECVARLGDLGVVGLVVGDGPGLPALQAMAGRLGVSERMRFVGRVRGEELGLWMSAIDVFLHTALNNPMSEVRTTGKLPLLLAAGSAAVVSEVGEAARVLQGTGLLLPFNRSAAEYAEALAARVRQIVAGGGLARWRAAGPALARRYFDYARLGARAADLIARLADSR